MNFLSTVITTITVSKVLTYGFILALLVFVYLVWKASYNSDNKFNWLDLISNPDGTASLTRTLQLVAGVSGTWAIIQATSGHWLTEGLFAIYLGAMGLSEAWTKWVQSKEQK